MCWRAKQGEEEEQGGEAMEGDTSEVQTEACGTSASPSSSSVKMDSYLFSLVVLVVSRCSVTVLLDGASFLGR